MSLHFCMQTAYSSGGFFMEQDPVRFFFRTINKIILHNFPPLNLKCSFCACFPLVLLSRPLMSPRNILQFCNPDVPTIPFYLFVKHLMLEYIFLQTPFQSAPTLSIRFALLLYCSACTTLHFYTLYYTPKTFNYDYMKERRHLVTC